MSSHPRLMAPLALLLTLVLAPGAATAERPAIHADAVAIGAEALPAGISINHKGRPVQCRLVRQDFKYPLIRIETPIVPAGAPAAAKARTTAAPLSMVADHLMVSLSPDLDAGQIAALAQDLGMSIRNRIGRNRNKCLVSFPVSSHDDLPAALARLRTTPGVVTVEPDWIIKPDVTPNDPMFGATWGMTTIRAPEAWNLTTGSRQVLVGVIDTGIKYDHPDLVANMWTNPGESGLDANGHDKQTNQIDDDGNGYVDDWHGWNFNNNSNDPMDDQGHGTHVAGTIGGTGNNGIGVAGVCWKVSLVGIKFLGDFGGTTSDSIAAVEYANTLPLALTNNSWGGGEYSQLLREAIQAGHSANHLFVAAAGNSSDDNDQVPHYPSSYDCTNIIAVASTTNGDQMSGFSCYGLTSVDLAAPGSNIWSTSITGGYESMNGTSMATPHVSGACALLKSRYPEYTDLQIRELIMTFVDAIPAMDGKCVTGGRLNLRDSLWRIAISSLPANTTIKVGETATFKVKTVPWTTYTYQWYKNNDPIPNATYSAFTTLPAVIGDDQTTYYCVATSDIDIVPSPRLTLTVLSPPTIDAPPAGSYTNPYLTGPANPAFSLPYTVNQSQQATFQIDATSRAKDGGGPTYQWRLKGVNIPGATARSYTTPVLSAADGGNSYTCLLTNDVGTTLSPTAILTIRRKPSIIIPPGTAVTSLGYPASFLVVGDGTGPLSYQWQWAPLDPIANPRVIAGNWTNLADGLAATYTIAAAQASLPNSPGTAAGQENTAYRCVITNPAGSATSEAAYLELRPSVAILSQPASVLIPTNGSATLQVATNALDLPIHYQWFQGDAGDVSHPVTGNITVPTFVTPTLTSSANYWVRATDGYTSADSSVAVVHVDANSSAGGDGGSSTCGLGSSLTGLILCLFLALRSRSRRS